MKKKILSLVLVVAMLASMLVLAPTSGATEKKATLAFGNAAGVAGDTVAVEFIVTTELLKGVQFVLDYDESKLTFDRIDWTTAIGGAGFPVDATENTEYDSVFEKSSADKVLSWASGQGVDPADLSAGVVLATLSFTIKADAPVGDAYVNFSGAGDNNKVNYGTASYTSEQIEFVNGAVTVLPAGYIDASGAVVATAPIGMGQYQGQTFSTLILEEGVTDIGMMGIAMHAVDLTIIVLGNPTFQMNAIAMPQGKVTIYAAAGSNAQTYAASNTATVTFKELNQPLVSLTVGDDSYLVPADTKAPGSKTTDDGKLVIGWTDGVKTYAPGAAMTLTDATTLEPITIEAPKMNAGVGFQPTASLETTKMRYTTKMAIKDYEALAALGTVQVGTIITPAEYVSMAGGLTKEALTQLAVDHGIALGEDNTGAGETYIDVVAKGYLTADETHYTFAGSLSNFKADNINLEYAAAFYATVTFADGSSCTIYTDFDYGANRTVGATIDAAVGINGFTQQQANDIKALIAANK